MFKYIMLIGIVSVFVLTLILSIVTYKNKEINFNTYMRYMCAYCFIAAIDMAAFILVYLFF